MIFRFQFQFQFYFEFQFQQIKYLLIQFDGCLDTLVELELKAYNQLMVLIEPSEEVRVESNTGLFDLSEYQVNELQYEHSGKIIIRNLSNAPNHLRMIQVIPKLKNYGS